MRLARKSFQTAAVGGLAGWLALTALSQHPQRMFDRLRYASRAGHLVPDWRFFAPEPGRHDYHVLYRVVEADGTATSWRVAHEFRERTWWHSFWFPGHRHEKAMFDVCAELSVVVTQPALEVTRTPPYLLLRGFVDRVVRERYRDTSLPRGFQFVLLEDTGHEEGNEPEYQLASPFVPLAAGAASASPAS